MKGSATTLVALLPHIPLIACHCRLYGVIGTHRRIHTCCVVHRFFLFTPGSIIATLLPIPPEKPLVQLLLSIQPVGVAGSFGPKF